MPTGKIDHAEIIKTEFEKNVPGADPTELLELIAEVRDGSLPLKHALHELLCGDAR